MPVLRLFAAAREAAGVARVDIDGSTVAEMLETARQQYGDRFVAVLARSRVWVNGQPASGSTPVAGRDVVAVIPPVSGGAGTGGLSERGPHPSPTPEREPERPDRGGNTAHVAAATVEPTAARPRTSTGARERGWYVGPDGPEWYAGPGSGQPIRRAPIRPQDGNRLGPERPARSGDTGPRGNGQRTAARPRPLPERPIGAGSTVPERPIGAGSTVPERPIGAGSTVPERPIGAGSTVPERPIGAGSTVPERPIGAGSTVPERSSTGRPAMVRTRARDSPLEDAIPRLKKLAVVFTTKRPHGRLGVAWALVVFGATIAGARWLAAVLSITAFVGACQAVSIRRAVGERPVPVLAAATALALPLSAAWGMRVFGITLGAAGGLTVVMCVLFPTRASLRDIGSTLAIGSLLGLAAASPVLLRSVRVDATLLLLAYAAAYDAGAYLVGTGATKAWEGPAAGAVALIPMTILSTVVLVPPFPPGGPLLLGALAATLTPLGPLLGTALVGDREADVPGLRRLDSLLLLGPLWAAAAAALV